MMIFLRFLSLFFFSYQAFGQALNTYYPNSFHQAVSGGSSDDQLKNQIKAVLRSYHLVKKGQNDVLADRCSPGSGCQYHQAVGYTEARKFLFTFHLSRLDNGKLGVFDFYCDRIRSEDEFTAGERPQEGVIPDDHVMNTEHTWPQSKFTGKFSTELQKSDLHHLFPTDTQMNSLRGNSRFGEVTQPTRKGKCEASRMGTGPENGSEVFQPPAKHRGHVARALFYFSLRYDLPITPAEERTLKRWHSQFPVDQEEAHRNDEIEAIQGNRNPFIDFPNLVQRISDF